MKTILFFLSFTALSFHFLNAQTLNLDFPSVNGQVYALAAKGDTLFIGGDFIEVAELPRQHLAALDLNTGNLLDWAPAADDKVDCITVYQDVVYVCGDFQNINQAARNTLAAIDANDGTLINWNPGIVFPGIPNMQTGRVSGIAVQNDIVYIGGYFLSVNGQNRSNIAALDLQGNLQAWAPGFDIPLEHLGIHDHFLYASGPFYNVNGMERLSFASFDLNTGDLTDWNPQADNPGNSGAIIFPQDDHAYIAGFFTNVAGTDRVHAAKVDITTGALLPWQVNFINALPFVTAFEKWGDQLFMGGSFILDHNIPLGNLVAVDAESGEYAGWWADPDNMINTMLVAENKLIVGGNFTYISEENKIGLAVYDLESITRTEDLKEDQLLVYPLPASQLINIQLDTSNTGWVELYDIYGQLHKRIAAIPASIVFLEIQDLPAGIYSLIIRSVNGKILKTELFPVVH